MSFLALAKQLKEAKLEEKPKETEKKSKKKKEEKKQKIKRERKQALPDAKIIEELKALRNAIDELRVTIDNIEKNTIDETTIQNIAEHIADAVILHIQQNIVNVIASAVQDALSRSLVDPETIAKSIADAIRNQVSVVDPVVIAREVVQFIKGKRVSVMGKFPKLGRYREQILGQARTLEEKIILLLFFKDGGAQPVEAAKLLETDREDVLRIMRSMKQQGKLAKRRPTYRYVLNMQNPEVLEVLKRYINEDIIRRKMEIFEKELRSGIIIL